MSEQQNKQQLAKVELSASERFMNKVVTEYSSGVGAVALTNFQQRLAQNYFVAIDSALKMAEEKRLKKVKNQDPLPVTWQNVNMEKLSRDVVAMARIGFDPAQKNHINMVPFKNNTLGKYDITFVEGYRGMELRAKKYGLEIPDHVVVEVVYSTDRFKSIKKDRNNPYENYEFEITNEFDRGDVVGGFYYHIFNNSPEKNKLVVMSLKDIEKRKPQYASAEFWGGEKDIWEKDESTGRNKKVGTEKVEGWYEKMVWKTVYRAAYGDITIDSQKIDDDYMRLKQNELDMTAAETAEEIRQNANREVIDVDFTAHDGEAEVIPQQQESAVPSESAGGSNPGF
ncbi:recombinase RecT [Paenibacillus methanolicus]|uniref:Recombination protein RecT n=1 Tax=Paenibacillus methanolicus TaxID=582686 RepID=A0A5S5BK24_9BACL|nr:recombinase RecT [Paenibacillus methanolicus]TYP67399.1 recombination protein RecT [Paenibacillus methanolicus]